MNTPAPTASARAYEQLRAEIMDGSLPAGSALLEVEQAGRLGLSRTPVREALRRLLAEGLVAPSGARGHVVTDVSPQDVTALFEMRGCLEVQAAQLAARRRPEGTFGDFADAFRASATALGRGALGGEGLSGEALAEGAVEDYYALIQRFDDAVDDAAGNPFLVDALTALRTHVTRLRRRAGTSPERMSASAAEHALIAEAIARGDEALAGHATHVHLHHSHEHVRRCADANDATRDADGTPAAPSETR